MRYAREFIIVLLIFAIAALGYALSENKVKNNNLEEQIKRNQVSIDSLTKLKNEATIEYLKAAAERNSALNELRAQSHITESLKRKYEAIRHVSVPRLSDAQIDSAVRRLYPGR